MMKYFNEVMCFTVGSVTTLMVIMIAYQHQYITYLNRNNDEVIIAGEHHVDTDNNKSQQDNNAADGGNTVATAESKEKEKEKDISCASPSSTVLFSRTEWTVGANQSLPFPNRIWNSYRTDDLRATGGLYGLLISAVTPRPIALVSSVSKDGIINCAPFSYFNVVSHDPPIVMIGICINGRTGTKKDSLVNIEQTGQFVVNIISSWFVESANHTCGAFDPEVNEMDIAGLTAIPSELIAPPRVGESAVHFECEAIDLKPFSNDAGIHTVTVVTGKIMRVHIHNEVLTTASREATNKPVVDWEKLSVVGRLGGDMYTRVVNSLDLPRPDRKV